MGAQPVSRHHARRRWRETRLAILARDGYRCTLCGRPGRLEVDHRVPVHAFPRDRRGRGPGEADHADNLRSLCRGCHMEITATQRGAPRDAGWDRLLSDHER